MCVCRVLRAVLCCAVLCCAVLCGVCRALRGATVPYGTRVGSESVHWGLRAQRAVHGMAPFCLRGHWFTAPSCLQVVMEDFIERLLGKVCVEQSQGVRGVLTYTVSKRGTVDEAPHPCPAPPPPLHPPQVHRNSATLDKYRQMYVPPGIPPALPAGTPLYTNRIYKQLQSVVLGGGSGSSSADGQQRQDYVVIVDAGDSWFHAARLRLPGACRFELQVRAGGWGGGRRK